MLANTIFAPRHGSGTVSTEQYSRRLGKARQNATMGTTVSIEDGAAGASLPTVEAATSSGGNSTIKSQDDGTNTLVSTVASGDESTAIVSAKKQRRRSSSKKKKKNRKGPLGSVVGVGINAVQDDDVNVNLAMADLMAYLQLVAANSQDLPLTRRDDPELGKTVCTLSAQDYLKRAEAFLPCDVRVIGGSFTKYGRIRELPSSEDYVPADGAQEPGRSTGGACSNALLKVLYDAENEAADVMAQSEYVNPDNLFEEDDDDDDDNGSRGQVSAGIPSKSFDMDLPDMTQMSTISWADLLRKMKAEIQSIGYAQMPTITASRNINLEKAFSLVPADFDPEKNKKRSLLIGCNYSNTSSDAFNAEIKASHDDIRSMKDFIVNVHGFSDAPGLMTVLLDDGRHQPPTHKNIVEAFKALSEQAQPGDAVFVQFVGHGGRVLDASFGTDENPYDELIVPSDFKESGYIRDTLMFKTLLAPMRKGVTVTMLIDACDTGAILNLPYAWSTKDDDATNQMAVDDDFSFVRFLKVVKSLYESSTFTQLGKTVGTVLNDGVYDEGASSDDDDNESDGGSLETVDEDEEKKNEPGVLSRAFAACVSPSDDGVSKKEMKGYDPSKDKPSYFEKVVTCTLNQEDGGDIVSLDGTMGDATKQTFDSNFGQSDSFTYDATTDEESFISKKKKKKKASSQKPRRMEV